MSTEFSGGETDVDIVEMLRRLDGLDLSTDVELFDVLSGVGDGRVRGVVGAHDLFGFERLVKLVNILDCERDEQSRSVKQASLEY